ncbi:MAG: arginine--tRNA ligase [Phycisphaerae bacterium]
MPNVQRLLEKRVEAAMHAAFPEAEGAPALVLPAQDPSFGDYQANGAMVLAKRLGKNPREVAEQIVKRLDVSELAEAPEVAGPGFINLRLRPEWLGAELGRVCADKDDRLGVEAVERLAIGESPWRPETVVVDYSAPNLAKEMHVGHLRSTIIGDALVRMLEFVGHTVVKQNHVGDWGTQFGMLVAYLMEWMTTNCDAHDPIEDSTDSALQNLEEFYRRAKKRFDGDQEFAGCARDIVVRLQGGMPEIVELWENLLRVSMDHCRLVYDRLGALLTDADIRGESAYNDVLPDIVKVLREKGLLTESEGAQCVFPEGFKGKDGEPLPLIVQKSDEGYLYATTDLAAIRYRVNELHADRILYVVDARQALHFRMLFECAYQAEFAKRGKHELVHVAFGTMMGPDGKPFKTREGGTVKLMDLLDEAEKRALDLVTQKNAEDVALDRAQPLSDDQKKDIAHKVGIGAVKYADLAQNRTSDYVFSWEKMLSLAGNTAPYMQYAYARVRSIFRKGGHEAEDHRADADPIPLAAPEELALGKMLLRFPETLQRALDGYQPNVLAAYLYDLAQAFTAFYEACPVLKSEEPVRATRLKLCDLVARTIAKGLDLLGIEVADRM